MTPPNIPKTSHILAIDFGAAKVGLALADLETQIAFAWRTLDNDKDFFQKIAEAVEEKNVQTIVIGIPSHVNREQVEYDSEKIGKKIKELLPFAEIYFQDEMFTTKMAQANLIERGVKGIKKFDDQEAARIILQSWLDKISSK